jgi:hypothetical protein
MDKQSDNHLVYRVIKFGLEHQTFTLHEIYDVLNIRHTGDRHILATLYTKYSNEENPNHIIACISPKFVDMKDMTAAENHQYTLLPNAVFQYNDYLEIKAAREAAQEARVAANKANNLAIYAIIITVVVSLVGLIIDKSF